MTEAGTLLLSNTQRKTSPHPILSLSVTCVLTAGGTCRLGGLSIADHVQE